MSEPNQQLKSILDRYSLCTLTLEDAEKELRECLRPRWTIKSDNAVEAVVGKPIFPNVKPTQQLLDDNCLSPGAPWPVADIGQPKTITHWSTSGVHTNPPQTVTVSYAPVDDLQQKVQESFQKACREGKVTLTFEEPEELDCGWVDLSAELFCEFCKTMKPNEDIRTFRVIKDPLPESATVHSIQYLDERTVRIYFNGTEKREYRPVFQGTVASVDPSAAITMGVSGKSIKLTYGTQVSTTEGVAPPLSPEATVKIEQRYGRFDNTGM